MPLLKISRLVSAALTVCVALCGCAPAVPVQDAQLSAIPASPKVTIRIVQQEVTIRLASGFVRKIAAQSRWRAVGNLPQGQVLRPIDTVFTIEGRQIHEAYLVVSDDNLVGFYLPGEAHFSTLIKPISLKLGDL